MKHRRSLLLLAPLLVFPGGWAAANGGPVLSTHPTATGGIVPAQQQQVRLVEENLEIVLGSDGLTGRGHDHYSVEARYTLANSGPTTEVLFGVPLTWAPELTLYETPGAIPLSGLESAASNVTVELGGTGVPCELSMSEDSAVFVPSSETVRRWETLDSWEEWYMMTVMGDSGGEFFPVRAWCVVLLEIPTTESLDLTLSYRAELRFSDWGFAELPYTNHSARELYYLMFPAAYWSGNVERVSIGIDLGPYPSMTVIEPEGAVQTDGRLTWDLRDIDFRSFPVLHLVASGELRHREDLAGWNSGRFWYRSSPSSVREGDGLYAFDGDNAFDGDPRTAWCEGAETTGIGESVAVVMNLNEGYERFESDRILSGFVLVPGDTRSQAAFEESNRVRAVGVSLCDAPDEQILLTVDPLASLHTLAAVIAPLPEGSSVIVEAMERFVRARRGSQRSLPRPDDLCLVFTIEEVVEGSNGHTCISEIAPFFGYRDFADDPE